MSVGAAGRRPRLRLIALGGTIASLPESSGGHVPQRGARDLAEAIPALNGLAELSYINVARVGSCSLTIEHVTTLARKIRAALAEGANGVVVTHGTDAIEETAYVLSLLLERSDPVVLTGAMRTAEHVGADGPANLLAAVRVATTPGAAARGPVMVLQDEIHLARWVTKTHTSRVAAFESPRFGRSARSSRGAWTSGPAPWTPISPRRSTISTAGST